MSDFWTRPRVPWPKQGFGALEPQFDVGRGFTSRPRLRRLLAIALNNHTTSATASTANTTT